jgi:hypothetical protein
LAQEYGDFISAFTVVELGEMLPKTIHNKKTLEIFFEKGDYGFIVGYTIDDDNGNRDNVSFNEDTEANARAKMLIYLLENQLINLA